MVPGCRQGVKRFLVSLPVPPRTERSAWGTRKRSALDGADIVFLDPDNGLGGETQKHATFAEIRLLRKPERAIVFITFPGRSMPSLRLLRPYHVLGRGWTPPHERFGRYSRPGARWTEHCRNCTTIGYPIPARLHHDGGPVNGSYSHRTRK